MSSLKAAPFMYVVTMSVNPKGADRVIEWLDGTHLAEILTQPGFLWAQRVRLQQPAKDGWQAHQLIYALESGEALDAYQKGAAREKFSRQARERFAQQGLRFDELVRAERVWGVVEKTVEA
jgi:hypothetical protein